MDSVSKDQLELCEAVANNQYDHILTLLSSGVSPVCKFKNTLTHHFLTERALLNHRDDIASILLKGRSDLSLEEFDRIILASVRRDNLSFLLSFCENFRESHLVDISKLLNLSLEHTSEKIFRHFCYAYLESNPKIVEEWYNFAINKKKIPSIYCIFAATQIGVSEKIGYFCLKKRIDSPALIRTLLDCRLEMSPRIWKQVQKFPKLTAIFFDHPRNLLEDGALVTSCLNSSWNPQIGTSLAIALISGQILPVAQITDKICPEYGTYLLFFRLLLRTGSVGLPYLYPKIRLEKIIQEFLIESEFVPDIPFSPDTKQIVRSLNLTPFILSIDYLFHNSELISGYRVKEVMKKEYPRIWKTQSFQNLDLQNDRLKRSSSNIRSVQAFHRSYCNIQNLGKRNWFFC